MHASYESFNSLKPNGTDTRIAFQPIAKPGLDMRKLSMHILNMIKQNSAYMSVVNNHDGLYSMENIFMLCFDFRLALKFWFCSFS